jgi:hypothetical protein
MMYLLFFLGFDYQFNAIQNESNELFHAYKEMFEIAVSGGQHIRTVIGIYAPFIYTIFVRGYSLFFFSYFQFLNLH